MISALPQTVGRHQLLALDYDYLPAGREEFTLSSLIMASYFQNPFTALHNRFLMDSQNTTIGAVVGYIGAEGATPAIFERLLWPQRAHARFTCRHELKLAIFGSLGGPIYKAGLQGP